MNRKKIGLAVGLTFTVFIVGLLVWLNFGLTAEVPQKAVLPTEPRPLIICAGAPEQARRFAGQARSFLSSHKCLFDIPTNGFCDNFCRISEDRAVPCRAGAVLIALRDGQYDEDHADETISEVDEKTGQILWATVLLPEKIFAPDGAVLPSDAYALAVTHGLAHSCGFGHSRTHIIGSFYSEKTGELMNPSMLKAGWGVEGLP